MVFTFTTTVQMLSTYFSDNLIQAFLRKWPHWKVQRMMRVSDTMARRSTEIIAERKAALAKGDEALAHEVGEGKDIMSICRAPSLTSLAFSLLTIDTVKSNMAAAENEKMTDEEIQAQMS